MYMEEHGSAQQASHRSIPSVGKITIVDIKDRIVSINYPHNVELTKAFLASQDRLIQTEYRRLHSTRPQLLIQLDGIAELSIDCRQYALTSEHQNLYASVAYVMSKGNMSVLERHYLAQLTSIQRQTKYNSYAIGIFSAHKTAYEWLITRPGSHYQQSPDLIAKKP